MRYDETVTRKPARRLPWTTLLMLYLLLLGYGSLLPFEASSDVAIWDSFESWWAGLFWLFSQPCWSVWKRIDVYANVVLYVPAGVFALFVMRGCFPWYWWGWWGWLGAWVSAVCLVAGFSYMMESFQVLVVDRVASLNDFTCNTWGGVIGSTVALMVRGFVIGLAFVLTVWFRRVAGYVVKALGPWGDWRAWVGAMLVALACYLMWRYLGRWSAMQRPDVVELNWWPMWWHYVLSYDKALRLLIRSVATYAMVSGLVWVAWHMWRASGDGQGWLGWTLRPGVWFGFGLSLASVVELWRISSGRTAGDVTEWLTAAMGVGLFMLVVMMWRRGFARADRRRDDVVVELDRRRVWS